MQGQIVAAITNIVEVNVIAPFLCCGRSYIPLQGNISAFPGIYTPKLTTGNSSTVELAYYDPHNNNNLENTIKW